jgi:hypothetical protein
VFTGSIGLAHERRKWGSIPAQSWAAMLNGVVTEAASYLFDIRLVSG